MTAFLGMRGTGDWATDQRPKNWREMILRLYPNGSAALTAMMALMKGERVDDPEFNWWTKTLPTQRATVTGVYTDTGLSSAYVSGGAAGATLYIKMAEADASTMREGHQVMLGDASNYLMTVNAKVTAVTLNGASSYLTVKLLEADDNGVTTDLSDCDYSLIIGNLNAEGANMPDAIGYDPVKYYNYTQIFRTPLEITRTAKRTKLRTGDAYQEMKREALELHSIEMEKAFLFGVRSENTGTNGKPERTTGGLVPTILGNSNATKSNYATQAEPGGAGTGWHEATWVNGGTYWLNYYLENIFRYGGTERLAFCGSEAMLAINNLVMTKGTYNLTTSTVGYGVKVVEWVTPFGTIKMKTHPLLSYEPAFRNSMILFEPNNLRYRFIDDTTFYACTEKEEKGWTRRDGQKEEFLTEAGLEFHFPDTCGFLTGFGATNVS